MLTELTANVELVYEGEPNTYSTLHRISPWMYTNKLCAAGASLLGSGLWCQHWLEYLLI